MILFDIIYSWHKSIFPLFYQILIVVLLWGVTHCVTRLRSKVFSLESLWFKDFGWAALYQTSSFWVWKNFESKKILGFCVQEFFWVQKKVIVPKKVFGSKIVCKSQKILGPKNFRSKKMLGSKNIWKNFGSKNFRFQKYLEKILGPKKFWS